jgi:hypothetical protein
MEGRTFEFELRQSPAEMIRAVADFARSTKMSFKGDLKKGVFAGGPRILGLEFKFRGSYAVTGKKLAITISEKPPLVSWDQVGKVLSDFVKRGIKPV